MGVTSSRFEVHARTRASNQYAAAPVVVLRDDAKLEDALGVFKREVYAFALRRNYGGDPTAGADSDRKCLYLYLGWWRLARVEAAADRSWLRLRFRSAALRDAWFKAEERLGPRRWPLCERQFEADFTEGEPTEAGETRFVRNKQSIINH